MGLWVNRERVAGPFEVTGTAELHMTGKNGTTPKLVVPIRPFDDATCRVSPSSVTWSWPDNQSLTVLFDTASDSVYYVRTRKVELMADTMWFREIASVSGNDFDTSLTLTCDDTDLELSIASAHAQLLNLLAENDSLLYAGIPWFNEGWGRDTFISLPGLIVTDHHDIARKLLMRFAGWIDRDPNSPTYGRIPNRVRPG